MKLSEAIRLGAMMKARQAFGALYEPYDISLADATCAIGAAVDAIGQLRYGAAIRGHIHPIFPLLAVPSLCPICAVKVGNRGDVHCSIVHLNNEHRWTREQIADWVETIEAQQAQQSAPETVTVHAS